MQVDDGAGYVIKDLFHSQAVTENVPSWPHARNIILTNTNWSVNTGLKMRLRVRSDGNTTTTFEDPAFTLFRYNRNDADNT